MTDRARGLLRALVENVEFQPVSDVRVRLEPYYGTRGLPLLSDLRAACEEEAGAKEAVVWAEARYRLMDAFASDEESFKRNKLADVERAAWAAYLAAKKP